MGKIHNALDASLLGPAIRAALGIKDGTETIERFSETLDPIIDLWGRPEWAFLRGERLWSRGDQITGVAARPTQAFVVNPSTSGNLVIFEDAVFHNRTTNDIIDLCIATEATVTAALAGDLQVILRDLRGSNTLGQKLGSTRIREGTNAGGTVLGTPIGRYYKIANTDSLLVKLQVVIPPGFAVGFAAVTAPQTVDWWFRGRERKALAGELIT